MALPTGTGSRARLVAGLCLRRPRLLDRPRTRFLENSAPFSFLANAFLVGVAFFAVRGTICRHTGQTSDHVIVPIYLGTIMGGVWFGFVDPSIIGRGTASSLGAAAMFLIAAWTIRKADDLDRIDHLTVLAFVLTAATLVARPAVSYVYEGPIETEAQVTGSLWFVSFRVFAMLSWFSVAILFLLRTTTDLMKDLAAQSLTDPLTGVSNRRGFFATAEGWIGQATPAVPAALLVCDIDHFKRVNDSHGHGVGDTVIRGLADVLRRAAEDSGGAVGRLGGEEFVVFLPATNLARGRAFAEAIRTTFAARSHKGVPSTDSITVSIGVAETCGDEGLGSLIERADGALYRAKGEGRNRVEVAADGTRSHPGPPGGRDLVWAAGRRPA